MRSARDEIAAQEKVAFDERKKQHDDTLKQLQAEQNTLRDQLSETGGRITQVAQSVFDLIAGRLHLLEHRAQRLAGVALGHDSSLSDLQYQLALPL